MDIWLALNEATNGKVTLTPHFNILYLFENIAYFVVQWKVHLPIYLIGGSDFHIHWMVSHFHNWHTRKLANESVYFTIQWSLHECIQVYVCVCVDSKIKIKALHKEMNRLWVHNGTHNPLWQSTKMTNDRMTREHIKMHL